jgi:uncharacterized protein
MGRDLPGRKAPKVLVNRTSRVLCRHTIKGVDTSPFPYQGPLEPRQVRGRNELIADLEQRIAARRVSALLGPRRFGKTSVLRRVASDLSEVSTVWVDLYEVSSMADVVVRFDDALAATMGGFAARARSLAASFSLSLGVVKVHLSGPARQRPDPLLTFRNLLNVLVQTAEREATLLVIDEFSSISGVKAAAGMLWTALQHHFQQVGLVFAGSQPSMMRPLFGSRPEPFYAQADLVEIEPLSALAVEQIVTSGFETTRRDAGPLPTLLYAFAKGHPQRTMQLADAAWRRCPPGTAADAGIWAEALDGVLRETGSGMERLYSQFTQGERRVLRSVARSGRVYGAEAELLDLSKGTATHARRSLLDRGDLADTKGELIVVDPVFGEWVRQRFPL